MLTSRLGKTTAPIPRRFFRPTLHGRDRASNKICCAFNAPEEAVIAKDDHVGRVVGRWRQGGSEPSNGTSVNHVDNWDIDSVG